MRCSGAHARGSRPKSSPTSIWIRCSAGSPRSRHGSNSCAQIKQFELRQVALPDTVLGELVKLYRSAELEREQKVSGSKALSAWSMVLSGGALVPLVRVETRPAVDWFGWVELSYNLGGPWSAGHEQEYLKAREAELHGARYELSQRAQAMKQQLRGHSQHAEGQLSLLIRSSRAV